AVTIETAKEATGRLQRFGPGVCCLEARSMRGTQSELRLQGMVVGRSAVGVVIRVQELWVGDDVIFRKTPQLRRNRRADRGKAVSQAVTAIAEDSAAQIGKRLGSGEACGRRSAGVRVDEVRDRQVIPGREIGGEPAPEVHGTRL